MDNRDEVMKELERKKFFRRNGKVLLSINLKHEKFMNLTDARIICEQDMTEHEFIDSVNYLHLSGYVETRTIKDGYDANISDVEYTLMKARLTKAGVNLILGIKKDDAVKLSEWS